MTDFVPVPSVQYLPELIQLFYQGTLFFLEGKEH